MSDLNLKHTNPPLSNTMPPTTHPKVLGSNIEITSPATTSAPNLLTNARDSIKLPKPLPLVHTQSQFFKHDDLPLLNIEDDHALDQWDELGDIDDDYSQASENPFVRTMIEPRYVKGTCKFLSDFECGALYFKKLKNISTTAKDKEIQYWAKNRLHGLQQNLIVGNCDSIAEAAFENFGIMMTRIAEHAKSFDSYDELVINEPFVIDTIIKFLPRAIEAFYERHCLSITMSKIEGILNHEKPGYNLLKKSPFRKMGRTLLYLPSEKKNKPHLDESLLKQLEARVFGTELEEYNKLIENLHTSSLLDATGLGQKQDNILIFNHFFPDFTVRSFMNSSIIYYQELMKFFFTNMNIGDLEDGAQD